MIKSLTIFGALLLLSVGQVNSQNTTDSLAGFDEGAAIWASISENFMGQELKVHLAQMKRKYIKDKFSLKTEPSDQFVSYYKTVVAACVNEDFEASSAGAITTSNQVTGWTMTRGSNSNMSNNNCNLIGCCTTNPSEGAIIVAPNGLIDPNIGSNYPIYSVFGSVAGHTNAATANPQITSGMFGNNFIKINGSIASDYSLERISKTFMVSSSNALYRFSFIALQSAGHQCCDAGGFILRITNVTTNTFLSAASYSSAGVSAACNSTAGPVYYSAMSGTLATTNTFGNIYNKWHVNYVDLTAYIGQNINVEVTAGDCTAGGHYAYAYFDSQCGPVEIQVNGENKNLSCTAAATISAPANLNAYQWNGPSGFTSTASTFTTITAGVYSLTIPQNPPFQAIQKSMSLVISPASVSLTASKPSICVGEKVVLNATGLTSYTWSHGAGSVQSVTLQPASTTVYTLTGKNADNCAGFAMHTVSVNACVGIDNQTVNPGTVLFPNPNNGEFSLNVNRSLNKGELIITNNLGQVVHTQSIQKGDNKIKIKGLAGGVYYYSVTDNDVVLTKGKLNIE